MALRVRSDISRSPPASTPRRSCTCRAGSRRCRGSRCSTTRRSWARTPFRARERHPPGRDAEERRDLRDHAAPTRRAFRHLDRDRQALGRAALRSKLKEPRVRARRHQLNDVFVRFKALADRKKGKVFEDDLFALMRDYTGTNVGGAPRGENSSRVICGTEAPQSARPHHLAWAKRKADPPRRATDGGRGVHGRERRPSRTMRGSTSPGACRDARAPMRRRTVERSDGGGRADVTGEAAAPTPWVASAKAYMKALNRLLVRRQKSTPTPT